ncbi:ARM repeat-containing protein [Terfezia boudieri ATCC MYA-4762]|uniref:ARM repeat-containing protein n=1 Tax=Terfezia boudieri ATCC MYA-4762 TaxID=1051890 RepID=A0A3N4LBE9_9PEZI|nr:ARM repeat-containing protein [Terfezia boudieri ATCC MYA-4762]
MDFLKSAVASAISKGPPFPYSFGERVDVDNSIWALHNGTKREDSSDCSIFSFDVNANRSRLPLAKNALRKLRTLRHPGVVRVLDTVETDSYIYIATERVTPLAWNVKRKALNVETIKWGLHTVAKTLKFINEDASSVHGNLRVSSIFATESGEWKLAGFEVLSSLKEDDPVIYRFGGLLPDSSRYASPEIVKGGWDVLKEQSIPVTDAYLFGILIYEAFNGGGFISADQLASTKSIPQSVLQSYKRLIQPNPKTRLSIAQFLAQGIRKGGFFDTPLIHVAEFVENMGVKGETEREEFLNLLEETGDQFPEDFFRMKVLPELLKAVEYGGGGPKVFSVVLKIGEKLTSEEWESKIVPVVVRLFSIPDRAIRVFLLDNLPKMIEHIPNRVVNDKIFPDMMTGFSDLSPVVREQSVKAVLVIINKLSDRTINGDLLKYLAKTQNDEQPGIRTNTTICLGKIAKNLGPNTRQKVLTAAFTRSLRDSFVHARNAALLALSATADVFDENDCAQKILPALCLSLIDKEKIIRVQAQKTLEVFLQRVKSLTENYPETVLPPPLADGANSGAVTVGPNIPRIGTPQTDDSWAGWAISSFTKNLSKAVGELESTNNTATSTLNGSSGMGPRSPLESSIGKLGVPTPTTPRTTPPAPSSNLRKSFTAPKMHKPSSFLGEDDNEDNDPDAWGDLEEEKYFDAPATKPPARKISENEELDFVSLIQPKKKELPKGLSKPATMTKTSVVTSPKVPAKATVTKAPVTKAPVTKAPVTKPVIGSSTTVKAATNSMAKKPVIAPSKKSVAANADEKDGWGNDDGWDDGW